MNYPIPPWLHPQGDPVSEYVQAYHVGAQIAAQRSQLQQRAAEANARTAMEQMQIEARQEAQARDADLQAQRLEVQKQYEQAQIAMRQAQLDQAGKWAEAQTAIAKQKLQAQQDLAARKAGAQQQYEDYAQGLIADGEPEATAYASAAMRFGPQMGMATGGVISSMKRAEPKDYGQISREDLGGGYTAVYRQGSPGMHVLSPRRQAQVPLSVLAKIADAMPNLRREAERQGTNSPAAKVLDRFNRALDESTDQAPAAGKLPKVTTQEQFDALDDGAAYIGPDGKKYQKPKTAPSAPAPDDTMPQQEQDETAASVDEETDEGEGE